VGSDFGGYTGGVGSLLLILLGLAFAPLSQIAAAQTGKVPAYKKAAGQRNVPSDFQSLSGCTNPNTGVANHDWGEGSHPVFVDPKSLTVGTPAYTTNVVFWVSRETKPGQSVLLTGAFTPATKRVKLAVIPPGRREWQSIVRSSPIVLNPTQQSTTGLSFIVPSSFPGGVYGFEIEDPSAPPVSGLANVPAMDWAIGVPSLTAPAGALQHEVHDCGAEPGATLRIFGKNFVPSMQVFFQSPTGRVNRVTPSRLDANSIAVSVPDTLAPGTYTLWVGTFPWGVTSTPPSRITVYKPPSLTVKRTTCSNLVGDGVTDNAALLQSCLDRNAPAAGSKQLVYIAIAAGNFVLTSGVVAHPYEFLDGASAASTRLLGKPNKNPPAAWFEAPQHFGLANLSLEAPANPSLLAAIDSKTGNPTTSGHLFFSNLNFKSTGDVSGRREQMFLVAGPDIQIYNSTFLSGSNQVLDVIFGDGGVVSGNHIILNNWTGLGISDSQNVIFERNLIHSQNLPGQGPGGKSAGSGLSISRGNSRFGPSALSQNIYVGYNTFQNMGSKGQQIITNDGDGGSYIGPIAGSTAETVTLAHDPAWDWMGTTNPQASSIAIISGTGVGQYSFVKSYSGRTINLMKPWLVLPDTTSIVVISQYELHMTTAHNTITNTLGFSIVLGDSLESVIEDNVLTNSGDGIMISAYGPYGGPASYGPVINTDVLRNSISEGVGNLITSSVNTNLAGIVIQDMPGCLVSGLLIRDNVVPAKQTISSVDGLNGISAVLIEHNRGNWLPTFPIPGFLIQGNQHQAAF
jgi:hypothetical protein